MATWTPIKYFLLITKSTRDQTPTRFEKIDKKERKKPYSGK